jgi:hypothetical protein
MACAGTDDGRPVASARHAELQASLLIVAFIPVL